MTELNAVIHQPNRLRIMAALVALDSDARTEFSALRVEIGISDGNLSLHLQKLEEHGLVEIDKGYVGRRPRTWIAASARGREELAAYIAELESIVSGSASKADARGV